MAFPLRVGSLWSRLTGNLIGFSVGAASAQVFDPVFAELSAQVWARMPRRRLSPDELAAMVVRGYRSQGGAEQEASETGVNGDRFDDLVALAGTAPPFESALELLRRGELDSSDVTRALRQAGLKPEWREAMLALRRVLLGPETLAGLVARGVLPAEEGVALASRRGMDEETFERLVRGGQEPPAVTQVLDLLNRGELSEGEARTALRRAGLEARYIAPLLELRNVLPSPSDLVRMAVREVFTPSVRNRFGLDQDFPGELVEHGRRIGLDEETLRLYWAAHWDLPSPEMGFRMFHRDIIGRNDLELLLRSLDVMPFWRGRLIELAFNVPGRIDLRRMFQAGVIDRRRVLRGYHDLGYSPADAEILTEFATREKLAPERDLTKAEVVAAYRTRGLTKPEAAELLGGLGFDPDETELILDLADYQREAAYRSAAVSVARARYVQRDVAVDEASAMLDRVGLPAGERDELIDLWTFERESNPRLLTEAQGRAAWTKGLWSEADYRAHLTRLGYRPEDVAVLAELGRPGADTGA